MIYIVVVFQAVSIVEGALTIFPHKQKKIFFQFFCVFVDFRADRLKKYASPAGCTYFILLFFQNNEKIWLLHKGSCESSSTTDTDTKDNFTP